MMSIQRNFQDVFTDAICGMDQETRDRAVLTLLRSKDTDLEAFGRIAQTINQVLYENRDTHDLQSVSSMFFPVQKTREKFTLLETCFVCLYNGSTDRLAPHRSRAILDEATNLLHLIGQNGFDVSQGTLLTVEAKRHPLATDSQHAALTNALMECKNNARSFMKFPDRTRTPLPKGHSKAGKLKL